MEKPLRLSFVLLPFLLCSILAISLPPSSELDQSNQPFDTTLVQESNSELHCFHGVPIPFRRPRFHDCGGAIRQLPSNHRIGYFHTGGVTDQFQLPNRKTTRTCTVDVEIASGSVEVGGTWLGVGLAATQLNMACVGTYAFPQYQGGYTFAGSEERLKITRRYSRGSGVEFNETVAKSAGVV